MAALVMLSACLTSPEEILSTETPSPSPIPTETIDWFPATQTPTPRPIVEALPTPDLRPDIGELILEEGFEDADAWPATSSNTTTVAVSDQNIALTLRQRADYLLVTRDAPTIGNFYLEVTANPSLCRDNDEYGLIVRATPGGSQYRFSLSCDGKAKVERFYGGVLSIETEFVESSLIPAVAPSSSRLAVWASGEEMRFFVNDFHLFTVRDRVLNRGTIGVFIRTRSTEALSVSFSEMSLWALEP
jgi:hypothetical protein